MVRSTTMTRVRLAALLLVSAFCVASFIAAATYVTDPAAAAKKKKCKKGYQRVGKKCKRKPFVIKPSSITLVVAKVRDGRFGATGYAYFPKTPRESVLRGYWHISNGVGYERLKVEWLVAKDATHTNFTDTNRKVGITGENMTATLVVQGVQSNAQEAIK